MSHIQQMLMAHPHDPLSDRSVAVECITACYSCAEACLGEKEVAHQVTCIRLDLDCADIGASIGLIASGSR